MTDSGKSQPIVLHMQTRRERWHWARLRKNRRGWGAGHQGHCAVWYYCTPWGALVAAWRLHRGSRPLLSSRAVNRLIWVLIGEVVGIQVMALPIILTGNMHALLGSVVFGYSFATMGIIFALVRLSEGRECLAR